MTEKLPDAISFGDVEIDLSRGELHRAGQPVTVEPQVLDLIAFLASRAGSVVSKSELVEAVWDGRAVSDSAISSRINSARMVLGDDGTAQRLIRTVPRRGFRFEAEVRDTQSGDVVLQTDKPSVAILPFQNMSDDADHRYFADGIADDIITDLSRYDELRVIARHGSFAFRESSLPIAQIARDLGAQYIVEGSVRRAGNRIRVTAQLIEAAVGVQLWAERYDRDLEDIFAVQDEITTIIVNTLAGQISRQHYNRIAGRPEAVAAYDHLLRATEHGLRVSPDDNKFSRDEALKAIDADPQFSRAYAILTLTYVNEGNNFWSDNPKECYRLAHDAARRAAAMDSRDPWSQAMLGIAELWHTRDHALAIGYMERAVELNPSNAYFRGLLAYTLPFAGDPERALSEIDDAIRRNPLFPPVFHGFRGRALLFLGRYEEAFSNLGQMSTLMPGHSNAIAYSAISHIATGRMDEARSLVEELATQFPHYRLKSLKTHLPYARTEDLDFILDNLKAAGLPD